MVIRQSKVYEEDNEYIVNKRTIDVIDDSCKFFGSSYSGRFEGSKRLLGSSIYKAPIIVEESNEMIYFPTGSSRTDSCAWISLKNIKLYSKNDTSSKIIFKNDLEIPIDISYESLSNQVLRASRLESVLRQNKNR